MLEASGWMWTLALGAWAAVAAMLVLLLIWRAAGYTWRCVAEQVREAWRYWRFMRTWRQRLAARGPGAREDLAGLLAELDAVSEPETPEQWRRWVRRIEMAGRIWDAENERRRGDHGKDMPDQG